jgi:hypothetical protein
MKREECGFECMVRSAVMQQTGSKRKCIRHLPAPSQASLSILNFIVPRCPLTPRSCLTL